VPVCNGITVGSDFQISSELFPECFPSFYMFLNSVLHFVSETDSLKCLQ
jgi:hypothetical protein